VAILPNSWIGLTNKLKVRHRDQDEFIALQTAQRLARTQRAGPREKPCPVALSPCGAQVALQRCPILRSGRESLAPFGSRRRGTQTALGDVWQATTYYTGYSGDGAMQGGAAALLPLWLGALHHRHGCHGLWLHRADAG